ncbi:actin [Symbiodinium microadriaticum]|uniref:Actin n=1 Tax=Symbiodinium microadriaticum TaxID=2951 RepID=A0A1Q9E6B9_SYMMI|nr:actin [Symbiodinium microadriaticum]
MLWWLHELWLGGSFTTAPLIQLSKTVATGLSASVTYRQGINNYLCGSFRAIQRAAVCRALVHHLDLRQMRNLQNSAEAMPKEKQTLFVGQFRKTKMCRFHETGRCRYGDECPFAHDPSELEELPDLRKTSICKNWQQGRCSHASERCPFAHGKEELRKTPPFGRKRSGQGEAFARKDSFEGSDAYASTSEGYRSGSGYFTDIDRQSSSSFDEEPASPARFQHTHAHGHELPGAHSGRMDGTPLVLDNGSGSVKVGYAGEVEPKVVYSNMYTAVRASRHEPSKAATEALEKSNARWEGLVEVFQAALDEMKVEKLFEELRVPAVQATAATDMAADEEDEDVGSVPSHPSQIADEEDDDYLDENDRAYTAYLGELLQRELGYKEALADEVPAAKVLANKVKWRMSSLKASMLRGMVDAAADREGADVKDLRSETCLVPLQERMCRVATQHVPSSRQDPVQQEYKLPDGKEAVGIHKMAASSVLGCLDIQKSLANSVVGTLVLSGGSTLFPGMCQRVQEELQRLLPSAVKAKVTRVAQPTCLGIGKEYAAFMGGSILASMPDLRRTFMTRYLEYGASFIQSKSVSLTQQLLWDPLGLVAEAPANCAPKNFDIGHDLDQSWRQGLSQQIADRSRGPMRTGFDMIAMPAMAGMQRPDATQGYMMEGGVVPAMPGHFVLMPAMHLSPPVMWEGTPPTPYSPSGKELEEMLRKVARLAFYLGGRPKADGFGGWPRAGLAWPWPTFSLFHLLSGQWPSRPLQLVPQAQSARFAESQTAMHLQAFVRNTGARLDPDDHAKMGPTMPWLCILMEMTDSCGRYVAVWNAVDIACNCAKVGAVAALRKGSKAAQDRLSQALLAKDVDSSAIAFGIAAGQLGTTPACLVSEGRCIKSELIARATATAMSLGLAKRNEFARAVAHLAVVESQNLVGMARGGHTPSTRDIALEQQDSEVRLPCRALPLEQTLRVAIESLPSIAEHDELLWAADCMRRFVLERNSRDVGQMLAHSDLGACAAPFAT